MFLFVALYFEVFLLITYIERRSHLHAENKKKNFIPNRFPSVTFIVPCWNEEKTLGKTIQSLFRLEYPKHLLKILIIDDGSTDATWQKMQEFKSHPQVELYRKENGGKHTVLNFGLEKTRTELVGCLDADSYIDPMALMRMVPYFDDPEVQAVTPAVKVWKPKKVIELIQKVEYTWGLFMRKMLSYLGAMYVTPGPASIFRRDMFEKLGGYRHAHQTEDMEIAMRMQSKHLKIVNAHNAIVYTVVPQTIKTLYKQRLRWTYGFIKNAIDYRFMFFKKEYGNLGMFILPIASFSILSTLYVVFTVLKNFVSGLADSVVKIQTVGFDFSSLFAFDGLTLFSINTEFVAIAGFIAFIGTLTMVLISRKMSDGKVRFGMDMVYYFSLYAFLAPLWLGKAVINVIFSLNTTWR